MCALLLLTAGVGACIPNEPRILSEYAHTLVGNGAVLLDVRTREEFDRKHLAGAVNIPVQDLEKRLGELPKDKPLVIYCRSGARSAIATALLRKRGYKPYNLGPMTAW